MTHRCLSRSGRTTLTPAATQGERERITLTPALSQRERGRIWLCAAWLAMLGGSGALAANDNPQPANPSAVLAPFLPEDAFAAAYVNLSAIDPVAIAGEAASIMQVPDSVRQAMVSQARAVKATLDGVRASGIRTAYAIAGLADVSKVGGPLVVVEVDDPAHVEAAEVAIRGRLQAFAPLTNSPLSKLRVERHAGGVLLVGTPATLDRYRSLTAVPRPELLGPLARLADDGAAAAIVVNPGPDFRRVVRELWPPMPDWLPELKPLTGQFLAEQFRCGELAIHIPPQMSIRWAAQMADPAAAETAAKMIRGIPAVIERVAKAKAPPEKVQALIGPLSDLLTPKVEGACVTLGVEPGSPGFASLLRLGGAVRDEALAKVHRAERMQDLKHLALAMFQYLDANKHFPASAAIRSPDGKPLLSWRVALLPYLDQVSLYKEFHLDEPWDSPHNRELVKKMPKVFADPGYPQLTHEGKTVYLLPVGPGTAFETTEGPTLGEITDGTSKTIMMVAAAPDRAVEWTRPADWNVDMDHPLDGLKQAGRSEFVAAICDGRILAFPTDIDPAKLRAMLTRAGGEVVDVP